MKPAIAIFVKTPGRSPVKTRLAERLGRDLAEEWHRRSAACVAEAAAASGLPCYWAVAEEDALDDAIWAELPRLKQGGGSLGRRMASVHADLLRHHGAAILLGADLPQIEPDELRAAASWIGSPAGRCAIGPARDGGFWLFGSNRSHPLERWRSVEYSAARTEADFVAAIGGGDWLRLEAHTDVDDAADLEPALDELRGLARPSPRQRALIRWLEHRVGNPA